MKLSQLTLRELFWLVPVCAMGLTVWRYDQALREEKQKVFDLEIQRSIHVSRTRDY